MDAILGFLNHPIVITIVTVLFGLWCTYHPAAKNWPNAAISFLNVLIAFIIKVGAPASAHADSLSVVGVVPIAAGLGFGGLILSSVWQAVQSWLIYKCFLKHPIEDGMGIQPQPPPLARRVK
jgi:hypothetical protein